ncbi:Galactose-1-phosphate uridylyltransferase [Mycena kentingensis (nom. inval.)]|nr:Galactose-1-phosphate uridylyltransferase [Mycena kentingensis (nom. inval.)]
MDFDPTSHPHRRFNPLLNEYILVSPHRAKRPWLGQTETIQATNLPEYDPECYLCPGNARMGGQKNPVYEKTYTFENDFAAVLPTAPPAPIASHPLLTSKPVHGGCDVILFHPRHDLTLSRLGLKEIEHIVEEWIAIYKKRSQQEGIEYVQIFENKGAMMGCSNPHPHCQVWSQSDVPTLPATELASLARYAQSDIAPSGAPKGPGGKPCMLCEYAHIEMQNAETDGRVVVRNEHWVAVVPWWATWPFEILLLPFKRHIPAISDLSEEEKAAFAEILSQVTIRYDNLFSCMFAYSMGIHQRPTLSGDDIAHLHLHFAPPLLRSATVRKFLVGYELMAEAQRDLTPEQAAARLRGLDGVHFMEPTSSCVQTPMLFAVCSILAAVLQPAFGYFVVNSPALHDVWVNGETHQVSWTKGARDGITSFDIEMSRLGSSGLTFVAKNVPSADSSQRSINILLQDVPPGDDYFLLFLNSTHGLMHATSQRFSVLAAGSSGGNMSSATNPKAATVTVSGPPHPTQAFATTFAIAANAARRTEPALPVIGTSFVVLGCVLSVAWTLVW